MALLFLSPSMPKLLKALAKERAANPLQPTSTGKHLALQPACWQSLTSPAYLEASSQGFFQAIFPRDCQLQQHCLLGGLRHKDNVWSQGGDCNMAGELQLMFKVHQQLPVSCRRQDACRSSSGRSWLVTSSDKGNGFLGGSELLCPCQSCADGFSNGLEDLVMPPPVPTISWGCVPGFLAWNTVGMLVSLLCPMCADLTGLEARHTLPGWGIWCGEARLSKAQPRPLPFNRILPSRPSSLLLHSTALQVLISFTAALTSSWTSRRPSFPLVFIWGVVKDPSPAWPRVTTPTRLLWRSLASASLTASSALHFLPVLTWIPALATFGSLESLYWTTSLALVTLNSSSKDLKGSCSLLVFP